MVNPPTNPPALIRIRTLSFGKAGVKSEELLESRLGPDRRTRNLGKALSSADPRVEAFSSSGIAG
jgi:hypothetical protein